MNTGQIIKSKTTERFTVLPNDLVKSKALTLEEKGLLSFLLSLPCDWVLYKCNLYEQLPDQKGTIDRVFKALQEKGFIVSTKQIGVDGKFCGWNHVVYDNPIVPTSANVELGQSAPIQKKENNTKKEDNKKENAVIGDTDNVNDIYKRFSEMNIWIEKVCMANKLTVQQAQIQLKKFILELGAKEDLKKTDKEIKQHFVNWLKFNPIERNDNYRPMVY